MVYLIILIAFALVIFLLLKKKTSGYSEGNAAYTAKEDPEAQGKYINIKFPKITAISTKELIDLSWKFLYDITETVLNKFSVRDQQETLDQGRVMVQNGMKYQHIVDRNPKVVETYTKKVSDKKQDSTEIQR